MIGWRWAQSRQEMGFCFTCIFSHHLGVNLHTFNAAACWPDVEFLPCSLMSVPGRFHWLEYWGVGTLHCSYLPEVPQCVWVIFGIWTFLELLQGGKRSFSYQWKREKEQLASVVRLHLLVLTQYYSSNGGITACPSLPQHLPCSSYWRSRGHGLRWESWKAWKWKAYLGSVGCQSYSREKGRLRWYTRWVFKYAPAVFEMNAVHSQGQCVQGDHRPVPLRSINGSNTSKLSVAGQTS